MAAKPVQSSNVLVPGFVASPVQEAAIARTLRALRARFAADLVLIEGHHGSGKTSLLGELQRRIGGKVLDINDLMRLTAGRDAQRFEQSVFDLVRDALREHDIVYFDGVKLFQMADRRDFYTRFGLFSAALRGIRDYAQRHGKHFVVTIDYRDGKEKSYELLSGVSWDDKGVLVTIADPGVDDYRHILTAHLGARNLKGLDVPALYASASRLSASELTLLCRVLRDQGVSAPTTEQALAVLDRDILRSNVDLEDVEAVTLDGLVGIEDLVARLDRAVLLPMNDPDLARELRLEHKHGVLLYGPPGTGKTTIGRALAHSMKGKFFMIDGDIVHDAMGFYRKVDAVFAQAQRNSPSVIFIDDADVILSDPDMQHFGRYLLTKLDGLQSETMAKVCVMMTAMNIAAMPAALLRSGRLEVWLETRLPGPEIRADMIESYAERLPLDGAAKAAAARRARLGDATDQFTPADLRRLVSDAAGRLGFDRHRGAAEKDFGDYLEIAALDLGRQKALADDAMGRRGGHRFY